MTFYQLCPDDDPDYDREYTDEELQSIADQTFLSENDIDELRGLVDEFFYEIDNNPPLHDDIIDELSTDYYTKFETEGGLKFNIHLWNVDSPEEFEEDPYRVFGGLPFSKCSPDEVEDLVTGESIIIAFYQYYDSEDEIAARVAGWLAEKCCDLVIIMGAPDGYQYPNGSMSWEEHDRKKYQLLLAADPNSRPPKHRVSENFPAQAAILDKLAAEILYERKDGSVVVYSKQLRKSTELRLNRMRKIDLIQTFGAPAQMHLSEESDECDVDMENFTTKQAVEAIALEAALARGDNDERGVGIWQGDKPSQLVVVNNTEAAIWTGERLFRTVHPRAHGMVLDFGAGQKDFFEFLTLAPLCKVASKSFSHCGEIIEMASEFFARWRWRNGAADARLVTGLVLATFVQTIWNWRPLVSLSGESNSGKTLLFEALGGSGEQMGIFHRLASKQSRSTAAGIRQDIANTAKIILVDEFENYRERREILEMFRLSSRGDQTTRGTSDQRGHKYQLRHMAWVAAIESGLERQPDLNRFIQIELLPAEQGKQGQLWLPEPSTLTFCGLQLLAIAIAHAIPAKRLAARLKSIRVEGIDARTIENYSVPTAMLASAMQFDFDRSVELLHSMLTSVDHAEQGQTDHEELLNAILGSQIYCGTKDGNLTVSQILVSPGLFREYKERLEACGIKKESESGELFISHKQVASKLLRGTQWEGQRIDQILARTPGAQKDVRKHIAGQYLRGLLIPINLGE